MKTVLINLSIINEHAPTEESGEVDKEQFYNKLETIYELITKHGTIIIMSDRNAKIEKENHVSDVAGNK